MGLTVAYATNGRVTWKIEFGGGTQRRVGLTAVLLMADEWFDSASGRSNALAGCRQGLRARYGAR